MPVASIDEIREKVGVEIGVSDWIEIDQKRIDGFAGCEPVSIENS